MTLLLLFLGGMNVANKYYYFCFAAAIIFIFVKRYLILDWNVLLLLILSLAWLIFSPDSQHFKITTVLKPFLYPLAYLIGRNFFTKTHDLFTSEKRDSLIVVVITVLAAGPFTHYLLNYFSGMGSVLRNTIDIWSGSVLSATGQAALACIMIGVAVAALFTPNKPFVKILAIFALVLMFLYNLILAGRTLFIITAIVSLACSIYSIIETKVVSKKIKIIGFILAAILILYLIYSNNIFGIKAHLENSNIYLRFLNKSSSDLFSGGRGELKILHLKNFWKGLWGGCNIRSSGIGYAHDLLLDTYDEAGIFALLSIIAFIIGSVYILCQFLCAKNISFALRITVLAVYVAVYLEFFVEPILQGMPWLFVCFCFINGMVVQRLWESKNDLSNNRG